ncbi:hypothetical protein AGRO_3477 [Agrobacterium sp. ATCC 31749]|nr:hypothetical protein AGRO_3477 [Agrobacterium sp. ATCC 31749]
MDIRCPPGRHCLVACAHRLFFSVFSAAPDCGETVRKTPECII